MSTTLYMYVIRSVIVSLIHCFVYYSSHAVPLYSSYLEQLCLNLDAASRIFRTMILKVSDRPRPWFPSRIRIWSNVVLMLGQHRSQRTNIKTSSIGFCWVCFIIISTDHWCWCTNTRGKFGMYVRCGHSSCKWQLHLMYMACKTSPILGVCILIYC